MGSRFCEFWGGLSLSCCALWMVSFARKHCFDPEISQKTAPTKRWEVFCKLVYWAASQHHELSKYSHQIGISCVQKITAWVCFVRFFGRYRIGPIVA